MNQQDDSLVFKGVKYKSILEMYWAKEFAENKHDLFGENATIEYEPFAVKIKEQFENKEGDKVFLSYTPDFRIKTDRSEGFTYYEVKPSVESFFDPYYKKGVLSKYGSTRDRVLSFLIQEGQNPENENLKLSSFILLVGYPGLGSCKAFSLFPFIYVDHHCNFVEKRTVCFDLMRVNPFDRPSLHMYAKTALMRLKITEESLVEQLNEIAKLEDEHWKLQMENERLRKLVALLQSNN